jgi:hypothetical protein
MYRPLEEDPVEVRMGLVGYRRPASPIAKGFLSVAQDVGCFEFDDASISLGGTRRQALPAQC